MERLDLYDINRIKTGKTIPRGRKLKNNQYRLIVHLCIFNSKRQMLIQHRQINKKSWPNLWDFTVGGSVISGETSQEAIQRELFEEIGLKLDFKNVRPSLTINYRKGFDDIYLINHDVDINSLTLQKEEVQNVKWASMNEIFFMLDKKIFIPYQKSYIELLFYLKDHSKACE